jgi:RimJ/RimL family protein N-acetyltransferase
MTPPRTKRVEFGTWSTTDTELASRLWCDAEVMHFLGGPYSAAEVSARLGREIENQKTYGLQYWPVFIDGAFAGCCGMKPVPDDDTRFEIGFHFLPAFWGAGYASEASRAVIDYAASHFGLTELFAGHHPDNASSRVLLTRLGFAQISEHFFARTGLQHPWLRWTSLARTASAAPPDDRV